MNTNILRALLAVLSTVESHPSITTFDPLETMADIALTSGDLTASRFTETQQFACARSTTFKTAGKLHFEFTCDVSASGGNTMQVGLVNPSFAPLASNYVGQDTHGMGFANTSSGQYYYNSSPVSTVGNTYGAGDTVAVEIDLGAQLIWVKNITQGGDWNGSGTADPATGVGGQSFAALGTAGVTDIYVAVGYTFANLAAAITANFGGTSFALSPSAGFSAWG